MRIVFVGCLTVFLLSGIACARNLAPSASISASGRHSSKYMGRNVADGVIPAASVRERCRQSMVPSAGSGEGRKRDIRMEDTGRGRGDRLLGQDGFPG